MHQNLAVVVVCLLLSAIFPASALNIIVPAYFYPNDVPDPVWTEMDNGYPTVSMVVANANNGPGSSYDPNYGAAINATGEKGLLVLGYVPSNYNNTPLATVESNINAWASIYGQSRLNGIFIDEGSNLCSDASYYASIRTFIHGKSSNWIMIMNPGTTLPSCFANSSDIFVTFESDYSQYHKFALAGWETAYAATRFYHIVYTAPNVSAMEDVVNRAKNNHVGYVYITNDTLPNPYNGLPSYWTTELSAVASAATTTTSPTTVSGTSSPASGSSPSSGSHLKPSWSVGGLFSSLISPK